jgi:hypothetical protein
MMKRHSIVRGGCTGEPPSVLKQIGAAMSALRALLIRLAKRWSAPGSGPKLMVS